MFNRIKNFLVILVVLVVVAIAAWNVNFNSPTRNFSDTMLANVEALANETGPWQAGKQAGTHRVKTGNYTVEGSEWNWSCFCYKEVIHWEYRDEPCCESIENENTACNLTVDC